MKKTIIYWIIGMISLLGMSTRVEASSSDLKLNHLEFEVQINADGSMNITEKWNIQIKDTNTLYKTFKTDKTKYSKITNVEVTEVSNGKKQSLQPQNQWSYHIPKGNYYGGMNDDNEFEIAWGVGLEDSSATKVYNISYQVKDAIAKYSDYAELYWQLIGKEFEVDANKITGTIFLPMHASDRDEIKVWGHTEDMNGEIYATNTNKIEFKVNQFRAGRYVEIRTLFPTQMITNTNRGDNTPRLETVIQEETTWANQANQRRKMKENTKTMLVIGINIVVAILTIFMIKSIIKNSKKIRSRKKLLPSQEIEYYREMPRKNATPAEALFLINQQVRGFNNSTYLGKIFSATLLDLSLKKIIDFEVRNEKDITIKIEKDKPDELESMKDEKVIYEFLKKSCEGKNGEITTKELEKYIKKSSQKVLTLAQDISEHTEQALYEKQLADSKKVNEKINITACLIFLVVVIILAIVGFIIAISFSVNVIAVIPFILTGIIQLTVFSILFSKTSQLTQEGIDEKEKWKGLKSYMEDFSRLDKREVPEIVIWEKFLVYATVFGIANKVLKQLKIVYPNISEELTLGNYGYLYLMMNTNFSNSFSNAISSSMSTAYSSATGGGGGFSVGGRRSDGGRRRRWRKMSSFFYCRGKIEDFYVHNKKYSTENSYRFRREQKWGM